MRNARAFGVRGLASVFGYSGGIDQIGARLNALGIETTCHIQGFIWPHSNTGSIATQAITAAKQGKRVIIYGHSMGGDVAVRVAQRMNAEGLPVALLACYDPTPFGCPDVPENVEKSLGWFQPVGLGGYQIRPSVALQRRIDLGQAWLSTRNVAGIGHKKVDDDPGLQQIFINWADKVSA